MLNHRYCLVSPNFIEAAYKCFYFSTGEMDDVLDCIRFLLVCRNVC